MKCTQRLYLSACSTALVTESDERAATLYAIPGDEIPESAAERFGLVDGHLKGFDPEKDKQGGQDKERTGGSDKERTGGGDKGGDGKSELTRIKGIGDGTAKALTAAGIATIADLAKVDPASPPTVGGLSAVFKWGAVVDAAKELAPESGVGA